MGSTLVVAPWGNPFGLGPARYSVAGCNRVSVASRTSLEAVVECFESGRVVVLVADTVAVAPKDKRCNGDPGPVRLDAVGSYTSLIDAVRGRVERWISKCLGGRLAEMLAAGRLVVEVVPGVGKYSGWMFRPAGNPLQSYGGEVLSILLRELERVQPSRVVVDLTHGVNYMPSIVYVAAWEASLAYTASRGPSASLELVYVNSEPYPQGGGGGTPSLTIHVIGRVTIEARSAATRMALELDEAGCPGGLRPVKVWGRPPESVKGVLGGLSGVGRCEPGGLLGLGLAAARVHLYSMPLAALYLASSLKAEDPYGVLVGVLEEARRAAAASTVIDAGSRSVLHSVEMNVDAVKMLSYAAALQSYIRRAVELAGGKNVDVEADGATLDILEKLIDHLARTYEAVARSELDNVRKGCRDEGSCIFPLGKASWPGVGCGKQELSSLNPRNFRAHAGLERNVVEAMFDENGALRLRYRMGCWEGILERLSSGRF